MDADTQGEIEKRIAAAGIKPPGTYVLEHGYFRSIYVEDPNGLILEFTLDSPRAREINRSPYIGTSRREAVLAPIRCNKRSASAKRNARL